MTRFTLHQGDCREVMRGMTEASADAIVCDPPYELTSARPGGRSDATRGKVMGGFMGMKWDGTGVAFDPATWAEALRVLKPGGHLLAFSGTRTYHRMTCAIEDAGFEIRDQIGWVYGSGFPKSHNGEWGGTALKPAWEPIVLARKPLIGTVEENWKAHGTGALNIDACRIEPTGPDDYTFAPGDHGIEGRARQSGFAMSAGKLSDIGRWPANLIHDGSNEVVALFPAETGASTGGNTGKARPGSGWGQKGLEGGEAGFGDSGSAARFFYCAKSSQEDRNEGCSGLPERVGGMVSNTSGQHITRRDGGAPGPRANHHPTVKPTELMRWLVRLVTPRGGAVLDPFMGSGSTGKAAMLEGRNFTGIDLSTEYAAIARARIDFALRQGHQPSLEECVRA